MKRITYFILAICLCSLYSCENDMLNSLDTDRDESSTKSYFYPLLTGPTLVMEDEIATYVIFDAPLSYTATWLPVNATLQSSSWGAASFKFGKAGTAVIHMVLKDNQSLMTYTQSVSVTVKEKQTSEQDFLKTVTIDGPKIVNVGEEVNFNLNYSSTTYRLNEIKWYVNDEIVSENASFTHTFYRDGYYTLKAAGTFAQGTKLITFEKEIEVSVRLVLIPPITPPNTFYMFIGGTAYYDIPDGYMVDNITDIGFFKGLDVTIESPSRLKFYLERDFKISSDNTYVRIYAYKMVNGSKVRKEFSVYIDITR